MKTEITTYIEATIETTTEHEIMNREVESFTFSETCLFIIAFISICSLVFMAFRYRNGVR